MEQINIGILAPDGTFTPCESYEHLDLSAEISKNSISEKCSDL